VTAAWYWQAGNFNLTSNSIKACDAARLAAPFITILVLVHQTDSPSDKRQPNHK
jgi:hypothetical protein